MADGYAVSFSDHDPRDESLGKSLEDPLSFHNLMTYNSSAPQPPQHQLNYSSSGRAKFHVVMVPYPVQGQINPMMQFAKSLTAMRDDIMVTLINNKHNHDCIQRTRASTTRCSSTLSTATGSKIDGTQSRTSSQVAAERPDSSCNLCLSWVDNGLPADFNYSEITGSNFARFHESTLFMKKPLQQLLQSLKHQSPPVSCVLFGTFCPWAQSAAVEVGIPNFLFWTQSASVFSVYRHLPLLVNNGFFPYNKKSLPAMGDSSWEYQVQLLKEANYTSEEIEEARRLVYPEQALTGRRPTARETQFRSRNDELTTWRRFLNDGIITQEQFDTLPGRFQPLEHNEDDEDNDDDGGEDDDGEE